MATKREKKIEFACIEFEHQTITQSAQSAGLTVASPVRNAGPMWAPPGRAKATGTGPGGEEVWSLASTRNRWRSGCWQLRGNQSSFAQRSVKVVRIFQCIYQLVN